jgi:hypothetical protein
VSIAHIPPRPLPSSDRHIGPPRAPAAGAAYQLTRFVPQQSPMVTGRGPPQQASNGPSCRRSSHLDPSTARTGLIQSDWVQGRAPLSSHRSPPPPVGGLAVADSDSSSSASAATTAQLIGFSRGRRRDTRGPGASARGARHRNGRATAKAVALAAHSEETAKPGRMTLAWTHRAATPARLSESLPACQIATARRTRAHYLISAAAPVERVRSSCRPERTLIPLTAGLRARSQRTRRFIVLAIAQGRVGISAGA